mmetsp:Transcript_18137/g.31823  ORF Transcript_18137/g.31823 Transcript_18137/m.31823 type:complete len:98 (-) Transcript_18137:120-413(-)
MCVSNKATTKEGERWQGWREEDSRAHDNGSTREQKSKQDGDKEKEREGVVTVVDHGPKRRMDRARERAKSESKICPAPHATSSPPPTGHTTTAASHT